MTATPGRADTGGSFPRGAVTNRDRVMTDCLVAVTGVPWGGHI